jgi:GntR family transcriptional regulator
MQLADRQKPERRRHAGVKRMVTYGGGRPAYQQVADQLRQEILSGTLKPGDKLPSAADLTRRFQISRQVADNALQVLRNEGLIYGHQGKGTFVRPRQKLRRRSQVWYTQRGTGSPTARGIEEQGGVPSWDHDSEQTQASAEVAARLGVEVGAGVMQTSYVFRADGVPIQLATSWEPIEATGGTAIEWPEESPALGVIDRFAVIGVVIDRVDEHVSARMPLPNERDVLLISAGVPVMVIERTYAAAGRPVETADIIVPADRYQLHYGMPIG